MSVVGGVRSERLARVATTSGHFAILAIDHVRSFAAVLRPDDPDAVDRAEIMETKTRIAERLIGHVGAVLIDPAYAEGTPTTVTDLAGAVGVVLGIEDGDYADVRKSPRLLPGWDVERAAKLGVDAVKISTFFDADGTNSEACQFVEDVADQCRRFDMPLFCEPLALMADDVSDRRRHILEGVRLFGDLGVDVLKIQFPERADAKPAAWADACAEVDQLSPTSWTLLSEGKDFTLFQALLQAACEAGASGFLGGRSIWAEAVAGASDYSTSADRLDRLGQVVQRHGASWDTTRGGNGAGEGS